MMKRVDICIAKMTTPHIGLTAWNTAGDATFAWMHAKMRRETNEISEMQLRI
jgi:hypothetical protein